MNTIQPPAADLRQDWIALADDDRVVRFHGLESVDAEEFFLAASTSDQIELLGLVSEKEQAHLFRLLAPDDAVDVIQRIASEERERYLHFLDMHTRREVVALLAYGEDAAGGLMSPRYARLRPDVTVDEAIRYLRAQAREQVETIYYAYVLDQHQGLRGVVSFRDLFAAPGNKSISEVMNTEVVSVPENLDQEEVARILTNNNLTAIPVLDAEGRMKGIVTLDDIVDVVQKEATEDIQKLGGNVALDVPYKQTTPWQMIKKRGGWLSILFVGEMLTASAMSVFEDELAKAVVLALFVPLIISSGGNSGSQASTLIIRAMALGEVTIRDWWRVIRMELIAGFSLGCMLAVIGMVRIYVWHAIFHSYGNYAMGIAMTVAISLVGVVTWGTLAGSMLPIVIYRFGYDPASASAPFVATLVDVFGLVIYFSVAQILLGGTLL